MECLLSGMIVEHYNCASNAGHSINSTLFSNSHPFIAIKILRKKYECTHTTQVKMLLVFQLGIKICATTTNSIEIITKKKTNNRQNKCYDQKSQTIKLCQQLCSTNLCKLKQSVPRQFSAYCCS